MMADPVANTSGGTPPSATGNTPWPQPYDESFTEVRYGETDQMGYAHHATAVLWFELGRVCWLRKHGLSYRELEAGGVLLPVVEMSMRYHTPGRFEDQIAIQTRLIDLGKTRVTFENRVLRVEKSDASKTLLITGRVELACLDAQGKIRRVPPAFHSIWEKVRSLE
jgi:acyl-CoA thioester hydrolase